MTTRRMILTALFWPVVCTLSMALPYSLDMTSAGPTLVETTAFAKNGNGGGGNGNGGNSGGKGGGSSNGGGSSSNSDRSGGSNRGGAKDNDGVDVGVRHEGGISEEIANGRYIMKDARGRTIINRRATTNDRKRIDSLMH